MNEPKASGDGLGVGDERRASETEGEAATWKLIRFIEISFVVMFASFLVAIFVTNPTYDDYTRFCEGLAKPLWIPKNQRNDTEVTQLATGETSSTPSTGIPGLHKFPFKLSYAIVLFALTTSEFMVFLLDSISRFVGEPINKLPMIIMLSTCEAFSLTAMIITMDMFLESMNGLVLTTSGLALGLSLCLATDIVYTSVRGNGI